MQDAEIAQRVQNLMDEEHQMRSSGEPVDESRLRNIEATLDQCWDLLRQRRARREYGDNPDEANVRSKNVVEGYQQ